MKKNLSFVTLFLILLTVQVHAKNLPPGSGQTIPANILILLDRTFSMNWPAKAYSGVDRMKEPFSVVQDQTTGHYFVAETDNGGIALWDASTPTTNKLAAYKKLGSVTANSCDPRAGPFKSHHKDDVMGMEYYNGQLYTAHLPRDDINYRYMKQFNPRVAEYYDTSRPNNDRTCREIVTQQNFHSHYIAIDIQDGIYYGMGGGKGGSTTAFLWVKDLTKGNLNFKTSDYKCQTNYSTGNQYSIGGDLKTAARFVTAITADSNNEYLYVQNDDQQKIWSFKIDTNGCVSETKTAVFDNPCGTSYGLITDPADPTILYSSGKYSHKICKIKTSDGKFVKTLAENGIADAFEPSTATSVYFMEPHDLKFNNAGQLLVANLGRLEITILNKDLSFVRVFGLSGVSRLRGAVEAIKAVVSDSSLTEGALFGFGLWSKEETTEYSGWDPNAKGGFGQGKTCNSRNCLAVKIDSEGAKKIHQYLETPITLYRRTHATAFSRLAWQYFVNYNDHPVIKDKKVDCQVNYVIVIGDGGWNQSTHNPAKNHMSKLANDHNIKSIMVAYGDSVTGGALNKFDQMAAVGGSPYKKAIRALSAEDLKQELQNVITAIISENLSYTAPAITGSLEETGTLFQAQFDYYSSREWAGKLKRMKIKDKSQGGGVDDTAAWKAEDKLASPDNRKIWTALKGTSYKPGYNNFNEGLAPLINEKMFRLTGNNVKDYHNDSGDVSGIGRCGVNGKNKPGVEDGILDDVKGLINFIRGEDYFDYNGDCNLTEAREHYLADIYNSQIILVGPPNADTAFMNANQESFFRDKNNYQAWANSTNLANRKKVIYAGANNGILHAFDADDGTELWGFVSPLIAGKLPTVINPNLNKTTGGGTVPIFAMDGSPVVHDMYFKSPHDGAEAWHTILIAPYGRGGAGFSVLDVTDPYKPEHLYSILNDPNDGKVYHVDHEGESKTYDYKSSSYNLNNFEEVKKVSSNYENNSSVSQNCNALGTTSCYQGKIVTINNAVSTSGANIKIYVDGADVTNSSSVTSAGSSLKVTLPNSMTYSADPNSTVANSTVNITIINNMPAAGEKYDYRYLAETWSSPRVFRLPNTGAGDSNIDDDIYVAVMGGGYGVKVAGLGSNVFVINLTNGEVIKQINIEDLDGNNIVNSIPSTPLVLTPDLALKANYRGALVYVSDLEGKITKINLTNMEDDRDQSGSPKPIFLYDKTTLFSANSTAENNRYMYHSMEAVIGATTENLWLFAGTGDYLNLNDAGVNKPNSVDNLLIGIKDKNFPNFKPLQTGANLTIDDLTKCKNTTNETDDSNCPQYADNGWYIELDKNAPTSSRRKKVTAEPTIGNGVIYFPVYMPNTTDLCGLGDAFVCAADDECGYNMSDGLGTNPTIHQTEKCFYVGSGALSKIVIFRGDLYANIAGETKITGKSSKDLLVLDALAGGIKSLRINWRENF